jgi:hypothetical protein
VDKIVGFGGLIYFSLVILNELIIKFVIGFDKVVRILVEPMEMIKRYHYFQCLT